MNNESLTETPVCRDSRYGLYPLHEKDRPAYLAHLLALGKESRRTRFGVTQSDEVLEKLSAQLPLENVSLGLFIWGDLKGIVQVLNTTEESVGELAISLNEDVQGHGWGEILVAEALERACAQHLKRVDICYLQDNHAMKRIASRWPGKTVKDDFDRCRQVDLAEL